MERQLSRVRWSTSSTIRLSNPLSARVGSPCTSLCPQAGEGWGLPGTGGPTSRPGTPKPRKGGGPAFHYDPLSFFLSSSFHLFFSQRTHFVQYRQLGYETHQQERSYRAWVFPTPTQLLSFPFTLNRSWFDLLSNTSRYSYLTH